MKKLREMDLYLSCVDMEGHMNLLLMFLDFMIDAFNNLFVFVDDTDENLTPLFRWKFAQYVCL